MAPSPCPAAGTASSGTRSSGGGSALAGEAAHAENVACLPLPLPPLCCKTPFCHSCLTRQVIIAVNVPSCPYCDPCCLSLAAAAAALSTSATGRACARRAGREPCMPPGWVSGGAACCLQVHPLRPCCQLCSACTSPSLLPCALAATTPDSATCCWLMSDAECCRLHFPLPLALLPAAGREYVMPVRDIGRHGYKSDIKALCERTKRVAGWQRARPSRLLSALLLSAALLSGAACSVQHSPTGKCDSLCCCRLDVLLDGHDLWLRHRRGDQPVR